VRKNILNQLHFPHIYFVIDKSGIRVSYDEISNTDFFATSSDEIGDNNLDKMRRIYMKFALHDAGGEKDPTLNTYSFDVAKAKFKLPDIDDMSNLLDILSACAEKPENVYTLFTQGFAMQDGEYLLDIDQGYMNEGIFQVLLIKDGKVEIIHKA
jgi:hypothetical protein